MSEISTRYLTRDEAIRFIRDNRYRRKAFVRIGTFGYTSLPDEDGTGGRGYDLTGLIRCSFSDAEEAVNSWISDIFAERGVRIRMGLSDRCLFVG